MPIQVNTDYILIIIVTNTVLHLNLSNNATYMQNKTITFFLYRVLPFIFSVTSFHHVTATTHLSTSKVALVADTAT